MKSILSLLVFTIVTLTLNAQSGSVKGTLKDTTTKQILQSATVTILDNTDSTLVSFAITKADGSFQINNIAVGNYIFMGSFNGFDNTYKNISITKENLNVDLGNIIMLPLSNDLGTVVVKSPPIVIKGDTTEMNATMFKTKPNALAEDLLKKLPGVEVAKDGTVKAQGETVSKILVDGKQFFGNDPKMATKNLPSDVIDKVQIYDAQSDQSTFSGFDDGNREKTINFITKKDKRKGYFGRASAGYGTDDRFAGNLSLNRFNGSQQLTLTAQANNINEQNFSIQDILGTMGSGGGRGGNTQITMRGGAASNFISGSNQNGITRTISAGLNYNDAWSKKTEFSGSYFYNNLNNLRDQATYRETFTNLDSSNFASNLYNADNLNQNHRFNMQFDHRIDSNNSILIRPTFTFQESDNESTTSSINTLGKSINLNNLQQTNQTTSNGFSFNNSILYRHKFKKKGRTISLNLTQSLNNNESNGLLNAYTTRFTGGAVTDTTIQTTRTDRDGKTFGANISYTEPIDKKSQIEISYNINYNQNNSDQKTDTLDTQSGTYKPNITLTNRFENYNFSNRLGLNYRRQISKEWNYIVGFAAQNATLESDNLTTNTVLKNNFMNYFPTLSIQYNKNRARNLRLRYNGATNQPNINQLQEVLDNSNLLNQRTGNAGLKQEFRHNINLFYSSFDVFTFKNLFAGINGGFTQNKIANSYYINNTNTVQTYNGAVLQPGAQYTRPVNLDGAYNFTGFINYGFPVKALGGNLNLTTNLMHSKDVNLNLNDNTKAYTRNYTFGETVRLTMNLKERLDLNFLSTSTYNIARYSQRPDQNGNFFTQNFSIEPTYSTKDGWIIATDFDYTMYRGQTEGYNQDVPLWNASVSKQLFKNKAGELKLSVFDILNQNRSITRTVEQNYIEDVQTAVVKRYFMLSFTYNLRQFGQNMNGMFGNMFRGKMPGGVRIVN